MLIIPNFTKSMLNKPLFFYLLNTLTFSIFIFLRGYEVSFLLAIVFSFFIILYNVGKIGFYNACTLSIIYLLVFDSETFSLTDYKIRIWYGLHLILLFTSILNKTFFNTIKNDIAKVVLLLLLLFSVLWFIVDSFTGKIYNVKYWLFSVSLIITILIGISDIGIKKGKLKELLEYHLSLAAFISTFGLLQFLTSVANGLSTQHNFNSPLLYSFDIRPYAFFSETTWFGEYMFFSIVIAHIYYKVTKHIFTFPIIVLFIVCMILSATRASFLSAAVYLLTLLLYSLSQIKGLYFKKNDLLRRSIILTCIISVIYIALENEILVSSILGLVERFTEGDISSTSRLESISLSLSYISQSPIWGQGFDWNDNFTTSGGTSFGAKSFNLFLMILSIFGLIGFTLLLLLLFVFYYKVSNFKYESSIFAFITITSFLVIAMVAPIHQFPFGMYIVAISIFFQRLYIHKFSSILNA
jgi:O-Antigen ligase